MEEKERFELFGEHCIKDNNPDARPQLLDAYVACVILNEQDKKIKAKEKEANTYAKEIVFLDNKIKLLERENRQLKQQLHELPKKIVEEIKDKIPEIGGMKCEIIIDDSLTLNTLLDTILKKYGDKNESNND